MDALRGHPLANLAQRLGEIAIAWNDLHFFLFVLFWRLTDADVAAARALFFSVHADRNRRDMAAALADRVLQPWPTMKRHVVATIGAVGKLEARRSDVMQAMWGLQASGEQGSAFAPARPLSQEDLAAEVDELLHAILDMTRSIVRLSRELDEYVPSAGGALELQPLHDVYLHTPEVEEVREQGGPPRASVRRPPESSQA